MRQYEKSYEVFFPFHHVLLRILLYIVFPVAVIGEVAIFERMTGRTTMSIIPFIVGVAELLIDYLLFNSVAVKNNRNIEYIKTSGKGKRILKQAILMDLIRKLISVFFIGTVVSFINVIYFDVSTSTAWKDFILVTSCTILIEVGEIMLNRFYGIMAFSVLYVSVVTSIVPMILIPFSYADMIFIIIMLLVSLGTAYAASCFCINRLNKSYYDTI